MSSRERYDFIIIGAGSAGCAVAAGLAEAEAGSVLVLEAGPSDASPLVKIPMALVWMMGGKRDWQFRSAPQPALGNRQIAIPRGRMLGGSGSINSMVWFRGRADDFTAWGLDEWRWPAVRAAFEAVEAKTEPHRLSHPHPLTKSLQTALGGNGAAPPTPEYESAGVFSYNLHNGRRRSAADAFLRPAQAKGVSVMTGAHVARLGFSGDVAQSVHLKDGTELSANKGIILSAGSIGSPEILLRSGIGPRADLAALGIDEVVRSEGIGQNLHDHPGVGLHFAGPGSGYGLSLSQIPVWAAAPIRYLLNGSGPIGSPTVEGGAFFASAPGMDAPDMQSHFIPFMLGWSGGRFTYGQGYFADVCICRPKSRGQLRLTPAGLSIDFNLLSDPADMAAMIAGVKRLRQILAEAPFGGRRAPEAFPGEAVSSDAQIEAHIRARAATAYHPVGTVRMGRDSEAPLTPRLAVRGVGNLWVADASVMPSITSANTNAPSMMIGHRAAHMIAQDTREAA